MNEGLIIAIIIGISIAAVPLIFAAIGELLVERSGVLNLGVEGMMIVGALAGFVVEFHTGSSFLAVLAALLAGKHNRVTPGASMNCCAIGNDNYSRD